VLEILLKNKIIDEKTVGMVREFISNNQTGGPSPSAPGKIFVYDLLSQTQNQNAASKDVYLNKVDSKLCNAVSWIRIVFSADPDPAFLPQCVFASRYGSVPRRLFFTALQ
jgi:hypothetical protein